MPHAEPHRIHRSGWLRASVLGANDGLVSTASLLVGMAASGAQSSTVQLAGLAGLVAGAMSMAAGEYVSVKSQQDTERADLRIEEASLLQNRELEQQELAQIYQKRGLEAATARNVARQLMEHDALGAHARDDIGISTHMRARPLQAALVSAASFAVGAFVPLLVVLLAPRASLLWLLPVVTLGFLALLGACSALLGGAQPLRAAARVCLWGALALALTAAIGRAFPNDLF